MKSYESKFQIGKSGLTDGVVESIKNNLKTHRQIRISVLKSATRDKEEVKKMADGLVLKLKPLKIGYKILGYTIILIRLK